MAKKLADAGKLQPHEVENMQKLMTRQFLPRNLDMDAYVEMRQNGGLDRLFSDTELTADEEQAAEATFRRCASLAVVDMQDAGVLISPRPGQCWPTTLRLTTRTTTTVRIRRRPQGFGFGRVCDQRDSFRVLINSTRVSTPKSVKARTPSFSRP